MRSFIVMGCLTLLKLTYLMNNAWLWLERSGRKAQYYLTRSCFTLNKVSGVKFDKDTLLLGKIFFEMLDQKDLKKLLLGRLKL